METTDTIPSVIKTLASLLPQVADQTRQLDDAATNLALHTNLSQKELAGLMTSYSRLSDTLRLSLTDVASCGEEWLQHGKSISETTDLIQSAMVLSKLANLSSADSVSYLSSIMDRYQLTAEDTLRVMDKLTAVDLASTADLGGLLSGMNETADAAKRAGLSMDELLGYLAAMGEASDGGITNAADALQAILTRMDSAELSRPVDEVLKETAGKWETFSASRQAAIASAFASPDYADVFTELMQSYDTALAYTETSLNASGQAMECFSVYEDSVTAHTTAFEQALLQLSNTVLDSGLINFFTDLGTSALHALTGLSEAIGPLATIGTVLGAVLGRKNLGRVKMLTLTNRICLA